MLSNRITLRLAFAVLVILLTSAGRASEVSWIKGSASPQAWSIEPDDPAETDVIHFSGPAAFHLNRCVRERELGGKPTLHLDRKNRTIELRFEPPPSDDCTSFFDPVCGFKGSFGPLEAGLWTFSGSQKGATFSMTFEVSGESPARDVYYVDAAATWANDGSSWADAFVYLQQALAVAREGQEIRVAEGVYRPDLGARFDTWDPNAAFQLKSGVILKGGYAGSSRPNPGARDVVLYESVLSGDLYGDDSPRVRPSDMADHFSRTENSFHVVDASGTDATAVLDGFTITGGNAIGSHDPDKLSCGGGIYNDGGSPTIGACLITGNAAKYYGGGVFNRSRSAPTLIGCTIAGNWATWWGGGIYNDWDSDIVMTQCVVTGNGAEYHGGGICGHTDGELTIWNSIISGNMAADPAWGRGGGLYSSLAVAELNHCTFVGNIAALGSTLACDSVGLSDRYDLRVSNCIFWDYGQTVWSGDQSALEIVYSDVRGGWPGPGNIDADPCFVQMGYWDLAGTPGDPHDDTWLEGDYHLLWGSPCVDTGDPHEGLDVDATDLDGRPRLAGVAVDMGAYELRNDPPVADAGRDVTGFSVKVDGGTGSVTLDASGSYDPEGLPLRYRWFLNDEVVSRDVSFTIELPVGEHTLTLVVSDSSGLSASDQVIASVMEVADAITLISPSAVKRSGKGKPVVALVILPEGMRPADVDRTEPSLLFPGGIKAESQSVFYWLNGRTLVLARFDKAKLMAAVPDNGTVELRVVGRLKNGRYFSGTDTVTIK
jgi:hypothetical protein